MHNAMIMRITLAGKCTIHYLDLDLPHTVQYKVATQHTHISFLIVLHAHVIIASVCLSRYSLHSGTVARELELARSL